MSLNFTKSGAIWDTFYENQENIDVSTYFSQIAIEVPHQTVIEINSELFQISNQFVLELEDITIFSLKFKENIDALITYQT